MSFQEVTPSRPSPAARPLLAALVPLILLISLLAAAAPAHAAPPSPFWDRCSADTGTDFCQTLRGVATSPIDGNVYVADGARIVEFNAWGQLLRTWGRNVISAGPDDNGSDSEICIPASGDTCQAGTAGVGAGEFEGAQGVAVDSVGDVYVVEYKGGRVQKFDREGHFLRMWGHGVNTGTSGNPDLCTNAGPPSDVCGAATPGTGPGQFSDQLGVGSYISIDTLGTPSATDDRVYVGDYERIQRFGADGSYQSQIVLPGEKVRALAVDPAGAVYVSICVSTCEFFDNAKPGVRKFDSSGSELTPIPIANPQALATGPSGELFVVDGTSSSTVRQFSPLGNEVTGFAFPGFALSTGIATGSACFQGSGYDLYLSKFSGVGGVAGAVRAYGPPPDRQVGPGEPCEPPARAPEIEAQETLEVEPDRAVVRATINPQFWSDTSYYVQYATAACIEAEGWGAPCVSQKPASPAQLGAGATDAAAKTAAISLLGLSPDTAYRFRFVAASSGGGPVFGVGGVEGIDGKAASFTTTSAPPPPETDCPNQSLRYGDSARLPDCRAYELVSPVDKNGGDITSGPSITDPFVSSPDGSRVTYASATAFGDQQSSKDYNPYLATRREAQPGAGAWESTGLNLPRGPTLAIGHPVAEVQEFSDDLCDEWVVDYNVSPLTPDGLPGYSNLYRRDLCGRGNELESLISSAPKQNLSDFYKANYVDQYSFQGSSDDGQHSLIVARAALTDDAVLSSAPNGETKTQLYDAFAGHLHLVSVLPDGVADDRGTGTGGGRDPFGGGGYMDTAVSADGSRVFWSSALSHSNNALGNPIYLRLNPAEPESDHLHGVASGAGDLVGPVTASGNTTAGAKTISSLVVQSGSFTLGQIITGPGIPTGTTITEVKATSLKISNSASASGVGVSLSGVASPTVSNVATETGTFQEGQEISGDGVPAGTTITGVAGSEAKLTLSAPATATAAGVKLAAVSECTEADKACTVPVTPRGFFWAADSSGSQALFSEGDVSKVSGASLYRFQTETQARTLVAEHVLGVLGASEDLSRVYFISSAVLTPGQQNEAGQQPEAGEPNLYLAEEGQFTYVGTLMGGNAGDVGLALGFESSLGQNYRLGSPSPVYNAVRISPDGRHMAFQSRAQLTGFDNADAATGQPSLEVFTYEAGGQLDCVSCAPSGVRPRARELPNRVIAENSTGIWAAAWIPAWWKDPLRTSNPLTANGKRLFFNSFTPLVAHDTNGAQDVYEWEAAGEGRCTEESASYRSLNGGCVYLISNGESPSDSEFRDASPTGDDVFFTTASSLLPQDPGSVDLYDARVGGGFAQPVPTAECEGEACQPPPTPPDDPSPASSTFRGAGNVVEIKPCSKGKVRRGGKCIPKPCPKGKVRRHGRCVSKHRHHQHHRAHTTRRTHR